MGDVIATAVFIRTESCDNYLYNFAGYLTKQQALQEAAKVCPEYVEHWDYTDVTYAYKEV